MTTAQDAAALAAAERTLRQFTHDGAGSNEAKKALDVLVAALRAPNRGVEMESSISFFNENADAWGAAQWFNRLANAVHKQDAAVLAKDDVTMEICHNVAASSAMRLVRDYERQVRASLASQPAAVREALKEIIRMDDDARDAYGKPGANLNGVGLVDLFDEVNHPFGSGKHKQQPYRSNQLEAALSDARDALALPAPGPRGEDEELPRCACCGKPAAGKCEGVSIPPVTKAQESGR